MSYQKLQILVAQYFPDQKSQIRPFTRDVANCFREMPVREFNQTFWLGESSQSILENILLRNMLSIFPGI